MEDYGVDPEAPHITLGGLRFSRKAGRVYFFLETYACQKSVLLCYF